MRFLTEGRALLRLGACGFEANVTLCVANIADCGRPAERFCRCAAGAIAAIMIDFGTANHASRHSTGPPAAPSSDSL
jgi:hypothetical protein